MTEEMWMENSTAIREMFNNSFVETGVDGRQRWMVIVDNLNSIVSTITIILMMFGMGAATDVIEMWNHLKRPWGCLIGIVCQFGILPAVGFGLCTSLSLPPYEALGVLILTCSPGGAFSNFFTYWVDGDLALSIMMTAISALLAFVAMPLNLWMYSRRWTSNELFVPYKNILISLTFVAVPAIVGMALRYYSKRIGDITKKACGVAAWIFTLATAAMLLSMYWRLIFTSHPHLVAAAALVPSCGVIIAYIVSKIVCFSHKISRTVAIETGCQNMVVATTIMIMSFPDPKVRVQMITFPMLYGLCQLGEIFIAITLFHVWRCVQNRSKDEEHPHMPILADDDDSHKEDPSSPNIKHHPVLTIRTSVPLPDHMSQFTSEKTVDQKPEQQALLNDSTDSRQYDKEESKRQVDELLASLSPDIHHRSYDFLPHSPTSS